MAGEFIGRSFRNYWLFAPLNKPLGDHFRLALPPFLMDGKPMTLPDVDFSKETRVQFIAPIQC